MFNPNAEAYTEAARERQCRMREAAAVFRLSDHRSLRRFRVRLRGR